MDDLDRMLTSDETIAPSSGFADGVMEAIEAAMHEPPPLPFPWRHFAGGVVGCVVWAASCVWMLDGVDTSEVGSAFGAVWTPIEHASWTAFGCLAAVAILRARTATRVA